MKYWTASVLAAAATVQGQTLDAYMCSFCSSTVAQVQKSDESFFEACATLYPSGPEYCEALETTLAKTGKELDISKTKPARDICEAADMCETLNDEKWRFAPPRVQQQDEGALDIRVSKAYGSRGYDQVRLSVISNSTIDSDIFTYSEPFKYRWTDTGNVLNTGIVTINPGEKTTFTIGSETVDIYIPVKGEGTRGVLIADPCLSSENIICLYKKPYDIFEHMTSLLNAINSHDDNHFWMILGDNFYDLKGDLSKTWFSALTTASKSKVFATVPGNHDFWVKSNPVVWGPEDQLGNGFMQFYGQDVAASVASTTTTSAPYDFSVNPDLPEPNAYNIPPPSNFFFYHMVGNVAFIGFSGAHAYADTVPYLEEACEWAALPENDPSAILLMGHWDKDGTGCEAEMTVPGLLSELADIPVCAPLIKKFRYFEGHTHCNQIMEPDVGFMVGAMGMGPSIGCDDSFGIPVLDTTGDKFQLYYFPITSREGKVIEHGGYDNYDATLACFQDHGVSGCYHLADVWSYSPL